MSIHGPTKSGKWEVRWREGSKNRSRTFDLKGDAVKFDSKVRRSSQLGEPVPQRVESETLDEVFANMLANRKLAPRTKATYKAIYLAHVHEQLGWVPVRQLEDEERLEKWQADRLADGAGLESITKANKLLNMAFKQAVRRRKMNRNVMEFIDTPDLENHYKPPIPPEQIEALYRHFMEAERIGDAILVELWGYEGLRVGEALALAPDDLVRAEAIWVEHSLEDDGKIKGTKNGKISLVKMAEPVAKDVVAYVRSRGPVKLLFGRSSDNQGWTKSDRNNWNRRYFKPACKAVELPPDTSPRDLRIAAASLRVIEGKRPTEIAEEMRHSLATSIKVYQRFMKEHEGQPDRPRAEIIRELRFGKVTA